MNGLVWFALDARTKNLQRLKDAIARWHSLTLSEVSFESGHPVVDILWKREKRNEEWPAPLVNIRLDRYSDVAAAVEQINLGAVDE